MANPSRVPTAPWRIGVDVGGTFTDLALNDAAGGIWLAKVPSVPRDPSQGVLDALNALAAEIAIDVKTLLGDCSLFAHGSTVATNTMLEAKGATVGLITTAGFRDSLEIRRGMRENQWNHREPFAPVLVPRYLRLGISGRIDAKGEEIEPLALHELDHIVHVFETEQVEAVAIALLNSYLNDDHEQQIVQALAERLPQVWLTTSSELSPMMGEYERTSTAVVNACLLPRIAGYLKSLQAELTRLGLNHPVLLVQSNGGTTSIERASRRPVNLLLSGPAAAVGALSLYRRSLDPQINQPGQQGNVISMEIGGTSCDVLLMVEGDVATRDDLAVAGYHVSTPSIDIHTIGAGGGTISGVDDGGLIFVGPQGAGADPGPACYGRGGELPTVTDAQLVLGRLRPGHSASNTLHLDANAANTAIEKHVAQPLGISVEQAAIGIIELIEQHLLHAVESISIERGHSPKRFTLFAAGGAGPMHGSSVAKGLGATRVYVPKAAGALCALGMLEADVRQDFVRHRYLKLPTAQADQSDASAAMSLQNDFDQLAGQSRKVMQEEGFEAHAVTLQRELDLQYSAQLWTIKVAIADGPIDLQALRGAFEAEYRRLYGHIQPDGEIVVTAIRIVASASTGQMTLSETQAHSSAPSPLEQRDVWHSGHGWVSTPVYSGADLGTGVRLSGPLLIEEHTTTILVGPGDRVSVDPQSNFYIEISAQAAQQAQQSEPQSSVSANQLDPIVLALMQNRLDQISRHMGWVMTRTARSTIFSQSHDFSCFISTADGTLVANADGIPIHTGGGGFAVRALLSKFAERIYPGDVFLLSDPYVAGGNIYLIGSSLGLYGLNTKQTNKQCRNLSAFVAIGRTNPTLAEDLLAPTIPRPPRIWHEGIRLPVLKLIDRGELRDDLWELLLINSRTPELLDGDLRAMLGSTQIGAERIQALVEELGTQAYFRYLAGVLDHAEQRMRLAIQTMPNGVYRGEDGTDNDCFEKLDIVIRVELRVDNDSIVVDFTGTDPQIKGFKNSSLANTYSAVFLAISSFFDTSIPRNEGTYRPLHIIAPHGSIVNARAPAPMTMNTVFIAHEIVHAIWKALGKAVPDRACAGWGKTMHGHVAGRRDDGSTWVMYQWHAMGTAGATKERDGFAQLGHLITLGGLDLPNLEFHEQMYPVRYVRHEMRKDAAGAGQQRGGSGVIYEADILESCTWSFRAEGLDMPTGYGICGGQMGTVGYEWIETLCGSDRFIPPKYGVRELGPARMIAHTPGGGGWGPPHLRDPKRVQRDVRDELLSVEKARDDYGVVIDPNTTEIDNEATARLRAELQS